MHGGQKLPQSGTNLKTNSTTVPFSTTVTFNPTNMIPKLAKLKVGEPIPDTIILFIKYINKDEIVRIFNAFL